MLEIIAFADTGKTTTLVHFAEARPHWRFLYVAFNKSVQLEACRKFPGNVLCKTAHSLAWPQFGSRYRHKLVGQLRVNTVMEALNLTDYETAQVTLATLQQFLVSAEPRLQKSHIPKIAQKLYGSNRMTNFVKLADRLWQLMQQQTNSRTGMPHDGYLKLFQQSDPILDFDGILLDEAQDTNPITADFLLKQSCAKVLVGDPHQQIYRFRGAVDAMDGIDSTETMYLTHSFRFGARIATLSNHLLKTFKGETQKVAGLNGDGSIGLLQGAHTIIARTNAVLFEEAVKLYRQSWLGFVGGIQGYRFSLIVDAYYLYARREAWIQDPYIKSFRSFSEMKYFAKTLEDWELTSRCKIVETYRHRIPDLVERIAAKSVEDLEEANVILTTAHKSKGLEFAQVKMAADFVPLMKNDVLLLPTEKIAPDEVNLIYVALTRTKNRLELPDHLAKFYQFMEKP